MLEPSQSTTILITCEVVGMVANFCIVYVFLQRFVTRAELREVEAGSQTRYQENKDRIEGVEMRLGNHLRDVERRLTDDIHGNRTGSEHRFGELGAKLDHLNTSVQIYTNEMNRVVGALEGKTALIEKLAHVRLETPTHAQ